MKVEHLSQGTERPPTNVRRSHARQDQWEHLIEEVHFTRLTAVQASLIRDGWKIVRNLDGFGLERKSARRGWNFFYMAGESRSECVRIR